MKFSTLFGGLGISIAAALYAAPTSAAPARPARHGASPRSQSRGAANWLARFWWRPGSDTSSIAPSEATMTQALAALSKAFPAASFSDL